MEKQELEELFPVGCVVSADIKEKLGFGEWSKVSICVIPYERTRHKDTGHIIDINKVPGHSFIGHGLKPLVASNVVSYQRIS